MDGLEIVDPGGNGEADFPETDRNRGFQEKKRIEWSQSAGQRCTFTGPLICPDNGVHLIELARQNDLSRDLKEER